MVPFSHSSRPTRVRLGLRSARLLFCTDSRSHLRNIVLGAALVLSPFLVGNAAAAEPVPGATLQSVRHWLITNNPQLQALQFDTDAVEAAIFPAGALPDPMASLALRGIDRNSPSLLPGDVDSTAYQVSQSFPLWDKRENGFQTVMQSEKRA